MSIITISHDYCSHGRETAGKIAQRLNYECLGPEIINEASMRQNLSRPETGEAEYGDTEKPVRLRARKEWHIAMFRAVFYDRMLGDNIVYHGLAGHVLLADVPNVLKVRLMTDMDDRVKVLMQRKNISAEESRKRLMGEDERRCEWTDYIYGRTRQDPTSYHLYVNLHEISTDDAADLVVNASRIYTKDQAPSMKRKLTDLALEAKTEVRLLEIFADVDVLVQNGEVFARVEAALMREPMTIRKTKAVLADIEGIKAVHVGPRRPNYVS